jgi:hypothetical protein
MTTLMTKSDDMTTTDDNPDNYIRCYVDENTRLQYQMTTSDDNTDGNTR